MSEIYQDPRFIEILDLYLDEDYETALRNISGMISDQRGAEEPNLFYMRGLTLSKLKRNQEALVDLTKAIMVAEKPRSKLRSRFLMRAYKRKGITLLDLERYPQARKAFNMALKKGFNKESLKQWLDVCDEKDPQPETQEQEVEEIVEIGNVVKGLSSAEKPQSKPQTQAQPQNQPQSQFVIPDKVRHEWYQTDEQVTVSVFIKKADPNNVKVEFLPREFTLSISRPNGSDFQFNIDPLLHEIDTTNSHFQVLGSKIEIYLKKTQRGVKWAELEGDPSQIEIVPAKQAPPSYPSSSKHSKNWDKIASSIEEEKKEGDEAVNDVFKSIYQSADDDTRRAMMKSYIESNGTSLSTNWSEVSKKKVETLPPDGMEARKWS